MERGLSQNTLGAYRADLMTLSRALAKDGKTIDSAEKSDLLAFIAGPRRGWRPSHARQQGSFPVSAVFFRYIMREGMRTDRSDGRDRDATHWPLTAEDAE